MILAGRLRQRDLNRPAKLTGERERDRRCIRFHGAARRFAGRHGIEGDAIGKSGARRLSRRPQFGRIAAYASSGADRLNPQMLRRRHIISRRERPRAARRVIIIAA